MFGLGSKDDAVLYGAIIDIGSSSVGVSIIKSNPASGAPETLFMHRVHAHVMKQNTTLQVRMRYIREALLAASLVLSRDGIQALNTHAPHARVSKILVTCSSPWSYSLSRLIRYDSEEEIKISHELFDDLVSSAEKDLDTHIENSNLPKELSFKIVERATVDVSVNDYSVQDPIGLRGTTISLTHITGLVPGDIIEGIHEIQEKIFPGTELRIHTSMLVSYCVLRDAYPEINTFCIVSITGETTEFGIVENGTLIRSIFAPYGINTLVNSICESKNSTQADALSMLRAFESNELDEKTKTQINTYLTGYFETIQSSITSELEHDHIPKMIILMTDALIENILKQNLLKAIHDFTKEDHVVTIAGPSITVGDTSDSDPDTYLGVAGRFFHKLHGCGEIDSH